VLALGLIMGCPDARQPPVDAARRAIDVLRVAAEGVPGGALLGVWVAPRAQVGGSPGSNRYDRFAYLVGGYAGVDAASLPPGTMRGRLMGYDGMGAFDTLCRFDRPARGVYGEAGRVYAVGDAGLFVAYDPAARACTNLTVPAAAGGAAPDLFAIVGAGHDPREIYVVGAAGVGAGATAVVYRFDGQAFAAVMLPSDLGPGGLRSVSYESHVGFFAVGERGLIVHPNAGTDAWSRDTPSDVPSTATYYSVSTEPISNRNWTMVVGDARSVVARSQLEQQWQWRRDALDAFPSTTTLHGVFTESNYQVFMVGSRGTTAVHNGGTYYLPPDNLTTANLLAIHGDSGLILAVGGTTDDASPTQSATVLIRGDTIYPTYVVDGTSYAATGNTRQDFGGGIGGQ
jgi:hypothetical protein